MCEALGLTEDANTWLTSASPECWPSQQQLQQAEQQLAVHQLVDGVLAHAAQTAAAAAAAFGVAADTAGEASAPPVHAEFLSSALNQAEPNTLRSWLGSAISNSSTAGTAGGATTVQGALRPSSAHRLLANQAPAQGMNTNRSMTSSVYRTSGGVITPGEESVLAGKVHWLKPMAMHDSWISIAKYLVDHGQYTAAMRLCTAAMELAR